MFKQQGEAKERGDYMSVGCGVCAEKPTVPLRKLERSNGQLIWARRLSSNESALPRPVQLWKMVRYEEVIVMRWSTEKLSTLFVYLQIYLYVVGGWNEREVALPPF